jgi:hypothetical protein
VKLCTAGKMPLVLALSQSQWRRLNSARSTKQKL